MKRYHLRVWTGPTLVQGVADKLRAVAMPWQHVTIEGTEHVHFSIDALHEQARDREIVQWWHRAQLWKPLDSQLLRINGKLYFAYNSSIEEG